MTCALRPPSVRHTMYAMSEELAEAVREILDAVPGTDLELAEKAGVPQSTISRIRHGRRGCTSEVARALADALAAWSEDCREAQGTLRRALDEER